MITRRAAVPDTRTHRGPDPHDEEAFGPHALPALRQAVSDLSWLLGRGFAIVSAVKLVGDRWSLTERQRLALRRASCSEESRAGRLARQVLGDQLTDCRLAVDGFNVVTTVEAALGGGIVLHCRDGTFRDLAGVHGTYRKVAETIPALRLIGQALSSLGAVEVRWLFDRPVSNSGRVRRILVEIAEQERWGWTVDLVDNPDPVLKACPDVVATADSAILDRCGSWFNLARFVIESHCPAARIIDLAI
jgi:hypothetical protein